MQIISDEKTVRTNTVHDLRDFNSQTLAEQAKKGEQLISMKLASEKALGLMGDDIIKISRQNETFNKNEISCFDERWLEESETKLSKQFNDEKIAMLIMSRKEEDMIKQY